MNKQYISTFRTIEISDERQYSMDFHVVANSYNCYGGHTTLSPIGDFLLAGSGSFGDAIQEIAVTLHFRDSGPAKKTLESLLEAHNNFRATLPKITYRRAKGKVEIDIASELMEGRDWTRSSILSLPLFKAGVDEVIHALGLLSKRLKRTDDFSLEKFLDHCEAARKRVPDSEEALQLLASGLEAAAQAKRDGMSAWEQLGIDWEDFHPNAREILDDPFFWNCTDDFSPNGNDTGADLLESYRDWHKTHKDVTPIRFLEKLAKQWGYADIHAMDDDVRCEASIALAFADIKLRAACNQQARQLALDAIGQQRAQALAAGDWSHREEKLHALDQIEAKLKQMDNTMAHLTR
ncbi:hypothetical protein [Janthinobacterium sp. SUN033]|uniref:hypothetical protein n=1 Tax=Janthinobacterium sp. SUN033 TaxID=3002439 RepID=UPI0025AFA8BC|nr:hypothetical protein [Janthinobacterium sp. SUN033]MDN2676626.1 hypothetical protein [Janthinobacterium sp. SUN033]